MVATVLSAEQKKKALAGTGYGAGIAPQGKAITRSAAPLDRRNGVTIAPRPNPEVIAAGERRAANEKLLDELGLDTVLQPRRKKKVSNLTDTLGG